MGSRLTDIIFDQSKDELYQDERAMILTHYTMAERCLQVEAWHIYNDYQSGDFDTLCHILAEGFKGFHNMEPSQLIEEYKEIEDKWYELYHDNELEWTPHEDDPIHALEQDENGEAANG